MKIVVIGGTGLVGSKTVAILRQGGHEVVAASPNTGVNTITGEGLKEAMAGTQVVIDLANSPSFEASAVLEFFETSGRNLLAAEAAAGVRHHVALSIVGTDRMPDNGYFRAKVAPEKLIEASGIPYTIIRSTQFLEFLGGIADSSADGRMVRLSPGLFQPIAADDVAAIVADAGLTGPAAAWQRSAGGLAAIMFGQPGFFAPRPLREWFSPTMPTSYYSTAALKETLEQLIDFDRINNAKDTRISVGAVNVHTGRFAYFDSAEIAIRPEHVMASGSLPPGFPPVEIDGEYYWDGGLVSNTPLQYVLDYSPRRSRLTFQVRRFSGPRPTANLEEVSEREKDICYSSRTRITTENFRQKHEVRHAINELMEILPPELPG